MNLLAAKLFDPAVSVSKATTAALAMTALDTTNLRLAVTVPAHGMVRFRLVGVLHGAATFPSILLGVMVGATVKGRVAPVQSLGNTAVATALVNVEAEFTVTGLTPGATNFDAAYGVETLVAATGLKYGGGDNATANDAFGAFVFEAWDPQPQQTNGQLAVDANGRVDVSKVLGTAQTAGDIIARLPAALVSGRMDASVGAMAAGVITSTAHAVDAIDALAIKADAGSEIADALLDRASAVDGITVRQLLRVVIAALAGKADGFPLGPVHYRDLADAKNRITATIDALGNRTVITLDTA